MSTIINHIYSNYLRVPRHCSQKERQRRNKRYIDWKGKNKLSSYTCIIIINLKNPKEYTNNRSIYLEPLKDAGDGVRYLLRYTLCGVLLTCWAFCLPALQLHWPFRQWLGCLGCPFCPSEERFWEVHWASGLIPGSPCVSGAAQERQAVGTIWPFARFLFCG